MSWKYTITIKDVEKCRDGYTITTKDVEKKETSGRSSFDMHLDESYKLSIGHVYCIWPMNSLQTIYLVLIFLFYLILNTNQFVTKHIIRLNKIDFFSLYSFYYLHLMSPLGKTLHLSIYNSKIVRLKRNNYYGFTKFYYSSIFKELKLLLYHVLVTF